jgi:hypothetical protein
MMGDNNDMGRGLTMKHTTHPQPHEQLLVGWVTGEPMMTTTEEDRGDATTTTTTVSPCSQGRQVGGSGDDDERERTTKTEGA